RGARLAGLDHFDEKAVRGGVKDRFSCREDLVPTLHLKVGPLLADDRDLLLDIRIRKALRLQLCAIFLNRIGAGVTLDRLHCEPVTKAFIRALLGWKLGETVFDLFARLREGWNNAQEDSAHNILQAEFCESVAKAGVDAVRRV